MCDTTKVSDYFGIHGVSFQVMRTAGVSTTLELQSQMHFDIYPLVTFFRGRSALGSPNRDETSRR